MSESSAVPDVLDDFAARAGELAEAQRELARRVERAVEAAFPARSAGLVTMQIDAGRSLRRLADMSDDLAYEVAHTARSFRAADQLLFSFGAAAAAARRGLTLGRSTVAAAGGARGRVASASLGGAHTSASARARIGDQWSARATVGVEDGYFTTGVSASYAAGVSASAEASAHAGPIGGRTAVSAHVGPQAEGEATIAVGRDGLWGELGGDVLLGAEVDGEAGIDLGPVTAKARGGAIAGISAQAHAEGWFSLDRVGFKGDVGYAFGLGLEGGVDLSVSPREIADGAVDVARGAVKFGKRFVGLG